MRRTKRQQLNSMEVPFSNEKECLHQANPAFCPCRAYSDIPLAQVKFLPLLEERSTIRLTQTEI